MEQTNHLTRRGLLAGLGASALLFGLPRRANAAPHQSFAKELRHHTQEELASALEQCDSDAQCTPLRVTPKEFLGVINRELASAGAKPLTIQELAKAITSAKPMPYAAFAEKWRWHGVDQERTFPLEPPRKGRKGEMVILVRGIVPISLQCLNPGKYRRLTVKSVGWPLTTKKPRVPRVPRAQS